MVHLLGIPVRRISRGHARELLESYLLGREGRHVVTANPEMLVAASRDVVFHAVLRDADLTVADGTGLVLMSRIFGQPIPERITGTDLIEICGELALAHRARVMLFGGETREAPEAAVTLAERHPGLIVHAFQPGQITRGEEGWRMDRRDLDEIRAFQPDILLVALGHGKQERWIREHLAVLPSVRIAIGVGGALSFLAGQIERAPAWMRRIGLEWLWRLWKEPRRIGRILTATIVFPIKAIASRLGFGKMKTRLPE